jgi:hypothetical protein
MTGRARGESRPRSWPELRQRVLQDDYLTVAEMQERKRKAHLLKLALYVIPVVVLAALPMFFEGTAVSPWLPLAVIAMGSYGAITAYRIGVRWEQRWQELIRREGHRRRKVSLARATFTARPKRKRGLRLLAQCEGASGLQWVVWTVVKATCRSECASVGSRPAV